MVTAILNNRLSAVPKRVPHTLSPPVPGGCSVWLLLDDSMTSSTILSLGMASGATVSMFGLAGLEGHGEAWAIAGSALAAIAFVVKALVAERRASAAAQIKAAQESALAKIKADAETVTRLREIEDERASQGRVVTEALTRSTIMMERVIETLDCVKVSSENQSKAITDLVMQLKRQPCQADAIAAAMVRERDEKRRKEHS